MRYSNGGGGYSTVDENRQESMSIDDDDDEDNDDDQHYRSRRDDDLTIRCFACQRVSHSNALFFCREINALRVRRFEQQQQQQQQQLQQQQQQQRQRLWCQSDENGRTTIFVDESSNDDYQSPLSDGIDTVIVPQSIRNFQHASYCDRYYRNVRDCTYFDVAFLVEQFSRFYRSRYVDESLSNHFLEQHVDRRQHVATTNQQQQDETKNTTANSLFAVDMSCKICSDRAIDVVCLPCGHLYACSTCIYQGSVIKQQELQQQLHQRDDVQCYVCRGKVNNVEKIFIA